MRLRAVAIYPPATTKILRGLGVNLHGLGLRDRHDLFMRGIVPIRMSRLFVVFCWWNYPTFACNWGFFLL